MRWNITLNHITCWGIQDLEKMGCRRIGSFLGLHLILGCGDQLCQILAASTRQLQPQNFDLIWRIRHHLLCQILFLGESVFEDQIVFPSKQTFCSCLRSFSLRSARNSLEVYSVSSSEFFLAILYVFTCSSYGLTSFQYARNVTIAFLVAFLVFSESLPSIKFCISSPDNL